MSTDGNRILSLDVMRGITIVGMILFNTSSGYHYAPLNHAPWTGLTLADTAFPFFVFIMGMTTWLSLRKYDFRPTGRVLRRIAVRAVGLILVCWAFDLFGSLLFTLDSGGDILSIFSEMRFTGVLVRLGVCYGVCALAALYINYKRFPYVIAALLLGYFILLLCGHGFDRTPDNILGIVDRALLGESHMCNDMGIDPEGILSTFPAIAHTMLGFWVAGCIFATRPESQQPLRAEQSCHYLFVIGTVLLLVAFLLIGVCPISKKIWSPTFVMLTSGIACLLLGLLIEVLDIRRLGLRAGNILRVFGINPLFLYLLSEGILWPLELIKVNVQSSILNAQSLTVNDVSLWDWLFNGIFAPIFGEQGGDLAFAFVNVLFCWLVGFILYRRKIFIRL